MTLDEMKKKALGLIEEVNPENQNLTDDPDIAAKINDVVNQIMFEICRMRKLPKYVEMPVNKGDLLTFEQIGAACKYDVYQVALVGGVSNLPKAGGTVFKILESGTAEIECYVYPEPITAKTNGSYEFELPADVLEIMPYGIAGDLLKSDISTEYGSIYSARYESMLQRLDPRYQMTYITIEGGVMI